MNIFKNYFYNDIMNLMIIGKYDNQYQIYRNQTNGRLNSKYGGHEYVNVPIKHHPIERNVLIAAYYLLLLLLEALYSQQQHHNY